jgi:diguanylate cyclase (GGDEF)-like protein/PAS domain S-box-containing protein
MSELSGAVTPAREARSASGELFRGAFEHSPTPTALVNLAGRVVNVNAALCELTGYPPPELLSKRLDELIHRDDRNCDRAQRYELLASAGGSYRVEQRCLTSDGRIKWCQKAVGVLRDVDAVPYLLVVHLEDISERKRTEARLHRLADYDALTGLRNRRVFEDDLRVQVGRCKRYGEQAALLLIDVDKFKQINDSYGHGAGDKVLTTIAATIAKRVRSSDVTARLGGDEFAVLLAHVDGDRAKAVLEDLRAVLAQCAIDTDGAIVQATASIGAAVLDQSTLSGAEVMHEADIAMYRSKRARIDSEQRLLTREPGPLLPA